MQGLTSATNETSILHVLVSPGVEPSFVIVAVIYFWYKSDHNRNVKLVFGNNGGYRIELVSPLDKGKESPVDQYLNNVPGTPYHICYITNDIKAEVGNLTKQGFKVVIKPESAIAFGSKQVVFLMNIGFGLMEIVEA